MSEPGGTERADADAGGDGSGGDVAVREADVEIDGLRLHHRVAGEGPTVLLLHGWPTSSFLWRHVMPPLARRCRVVALDLPGFGGSDKPLDRRYSFPLFDRVLDGFLESIGATGTGSDGIGLAVHDLGGPVGLHWAVHRMERVRRLALLNTLIYPPPSPAVVAFLAATRVPGLRSYLVSPAGLRLALRVGLGDPSRATPEAIRGMQAPFDSPAARKALLATVQSLHPKGALAIARRLPDYPGPVRIVYGARDRILPDVARTMARVARDLPQAETTCFPECGHFLQEERGAEIGDLLADFFA